MQQKLLSYFYRTPPEPEVPKSPKEQKVDLMTKLVNMEPGVREPMKLISDASLVIHHFQNDKIDVYTKESEVNTLLCISGEIGLERQNRVMKVIVDFKFDEKYPQQAVRVSIRDLSTDPEVKINHYYQNGLDDHSIQLNQYITCMCTWLDHMDLGMALRELKVLLTKQFPYVRVKRGQLEFHEAGGLEQQMHSEPVISIPPIATVKVASNNTIRAPLTVDNVALKTESGLDLQEHNRLVTLVGSKLLLNSKQLRIDIQTQKQQYGTLVGYKQQLDGYKLQMVWTKQRLTQMQDIANYCILQDKQVLDLHSPQDYIGWYIIILQQ